MAIDCYQVYKRIFILICIAILVVSVIASIIFLYVNRPGPLSTNKTLIIVAGSSISQITTKLYNDGVINYPILFQISARIIGHFYKLKAGEYAFNTCITPKQILEKLINGKYVLHSITFPEGITVKRVIEILNEEPLLFGEIEGGIQEGSLFPSTYFFHYGEKKQTIIDNMQHKMSILVGSLWENRNVQNKFSAKTKEEMVILASIIEKETSLKSEQKRIAAVFINRLNKGMKLQADPTIIYIVTDKKGYLGRALTKEDLQVSSEYNTYMNYGLPPTPISNPGKEALESVLEPLDSKELFFVADPISNGHKFTESLLDHNRNVNSYRNQLKQKKKNGTIN